MAKSASLKSHISKFNDIISELRNIDVKVDDKDRALLLLVLLPSS